MVEAPTEIWVNGESGHIPPKVIDYSGTKEEVSTWKIEVYDSKEHKTYKTEVLPETYRLELVSNESLWCNVYKETPQGFYPLVYVTCSSLTFATGYNSIATRSVGCASYTRDSAVATNEFVTIQVECERHERRF